MACGYNLGGIPKSNAMYILTFFLGKHIAEDDVAAALVRLDPGNNIVVAHSARLEHQSRR